MILDTNQHSVFSLKYHIVFCVKYRRKVIDDTVSERLKQMFERIGEPYKITLVEFEHDKDHIQILIKAHPKTELSKFINAYKSASSRLIKKEFPNIKQYLWKDFFWSRSFLLLTVGGAPIEVVEKYIQDQGE